MGAHGQRSRRLPWSRTPRRPPELSRSCVGGGGDDIGFDRVGELLSLHGGTGQVVVAPPRVHGCDDGDDAGDRGAHLIGGERELADAGDAQAGLRDTEELDDQRRTIVLVRSTVRPGIGRG